MDYAAATKRAKFEAGVSCRVAEIMVDQPQLQGLCKVCLRHTNVSLGELVRTAYTKNQAMRQAAPELPLHRVVRQRALWARLRLTFFAPDADPDALSIAPALTYRERLAYPCCCRRSQPQP
jgi:hypothetical protein